MWLDLIGVVDSTEVNHQKTFIISIGTLTWFKCYFETCTNKNFPRSISFSYPFIEFKGHYSSLQIKTQNILPFRERRQKFPSPLPAGRKKLPT